MNGLPVIVVALTLFFTFLKFFGFSEVILVSFLTLLFRTRLNAELNIKKLFRIYGMLMVISIFTYIANLNLMTCVVINLIVPFLIVYLYTDRFKPKGYFVYVMALYLCS